MIKYPCLFKLDGDDELIYIASKEALNSECNSLIWHEEDYLVDLYGYKYGITQSDAGLLTTLKQESPVSIGEITALIQAHQFSKAEVCLTKIQFASISAAICSLASDKET